VTLRAASSPATAGGELYRKRQPSDAPRRAGDTFDDGIAGLRYGTVAINTWTGLGYLTPSRPGARSRATRSTTSQSGRGVAHNALLLPDPERAIVRGPFRPLPKPPSFVTNRTAAVTGRRLTAFAAPRPRWSAPGGIFASALRG
jgi:aldehyde dehydrogenase (NAD(P)+)